MSFSSESTYYLSTCEISRAPNECCFPSRVGKPTNLKSPVIADESDCWRNDYLLNQQEQLLTIGENAEDAKILGSTYILLGNFDEGLRCWKKASLMLKQHRNVQIIPIKHDLFPPVTSKFMIEPEWTDLCYCLPDGGDTEGSSMDKYYDCDEKKLNLMYLAMLFRLGSCKQQCHSDVWLICRFIRTLSVDSDAYVKFAIFLFEWDELYAGHSLSLDNADVYEVLFYLMHALTSSESNSVHFEHMLVVLKWLANEFSKVGFHYAAEHRPNNDKFYETAMKSATDIVMMFPDFSITKEQEAEYKRYVMALTNWRNSEGRNFLLETCNSSSTNPFVLYSRKKVTQILIEAGVDLNDDGRQSW